MIKNLQNQIGLINEKNAVRMRYPRHGNLVAPSKPVQASIFGSPALLQMHLLLPIIFKSLFGESGADYGDTIKETLLES